MLTWDWSTVPPPGLLVVTLLPSVLPVLCPICHCAPSAVASQRVPSSFWDHFSLTRDAPEIDSTSSVQKRPIVDYVALKLKEESPTDPITRPESQSTRSDPTVTGREHRRQNRTRGRGSKRERMPPPSTINDKKPEEAASLVSQLSTQS